MNRYGVQPVHWGDLFFFGGTNVLPDFKLSTEPKWESIEFGN